MNAKVGKAEEGLKSWEKGLTSKQKIILETSIDGVKFGGDIVIVGGTVKLGTKLVLEGGVKKVFTKPDTPHDKTHTDTGGHKLDGDGHLGSANKISDEILTFADKNAARNSLEGTIFFREGNKFLKESFFAPAETKGYGKKYILEVNQEGKMIKEYKETITPSGAVKETKFVHEQHKK